MTQANRIVLNTLASYGRSLFSLGCGLFSTRWVLAALGKDDLGLFGLMGSCIVFVTLLNGILGGTVARFFAYAIGEREKLGAKVGLESVIKWFNAAFSIHAFLPAILLILVYPLGVYAINHWLVIPNDRIVACIWVFRMVLLSACINMASVPYVAMYRAHQLIVELSLWDIVRTIVTFACAYFLLTWQHDRLIAYAAYMTLIPSLICIAQMVRARTAFDGCRIRLAYLFSMSHLKQMFVYAFGDLFGSLGSVIRDNGTAFLINIKFGPGVNAAWSIANQVSTHTTALSSAMIGALVPAVTTAEGKGDHDHAIRLAFRSIKFGAALILVFSIPLIVEIDEVLRLWLVNPPEHTAMMCRCVLIAYVCHKLGWGHHLAILAKGRVVAAQLVFGTTAVLGVLVSWMFIKFGWGAWSVGISYILIYSLMTVERAIFARKLCDMPIQPWLFKIVLPLFVVTVVTGAMAYIPSAIMPASLLRIGFTSILSSIALISCLWLFVLDKDEMGYMKNMALKVIGII